MYCCGYDPLFLLTVVVTVEQTNGQEGSREGQKNMERDR